MPKQEIYYKLESLLLTHEVALNEEEIDEGMFTLEFKNVCVYVKGIPIAKVEKIKLFTLLFYASIKVEGLEMDDSLSNMVPQETQEALLTHSILDPLSVSLDAIGSFGSMNGNIDLKDRTVYLDFNESKNIQMLKPQLQKTEKGWVYETSF